MKTLFVSRFKMVERLAKLCEHREGHYLPTFAALKPRQSVFISNESNLHGGENIGGGGIEATAPVADGDDDDSGDGDSDPDRRNKHSRKAKKSEARPSVISKTTKRRDGAVEGKTTMSNLLVTLSASPTMTSEGFIRVRELLGDPKANPPIPAIIPVSKSSWWAGVKSGRYPAPVKLGARTTAWRVSDIRALIEAA